MKQILEYINEHKLVLIAVAVVTGACYWWWCVVNDWAERVAPGDGAWTPNLLGDSFGFINAILTAAAFIAVVLTYKKEQKQLDALMNERDARADEFQQTKNKWYDDEHSRKKELSRTLLIDQFNNTLRIMHEKHERIIQDVGSNIGREAYVRGAIVSSKYHFAAIDQWCMLATEQASPLSTYDRLTMARMLVASLAGNQLESLYVIAESDDEVMRDSVYDLVRFVTVETIRPEVRNRLIAAMKRQSPLTPSE